MRLIDADKLKKHIRRCDDSATRATFDYVDEYDIDDAPTVSDIEQIRTEIADWQTNIRNNEYNAEMYDFVFERIFEIIEKYRKGE